ncbi:hypothetical protein PBY51_012889 [Eleginops maclovinus]|uniref:Uncharacterized protein n=1 Tax=Eleginops maclovinus TaxID=56733 RepID=A0AAN7Y5L3_ELEMC|nr:hypothetical protein PBY51_012889 [Eleginops maclovinus]
MRTARPSGEVSNVNLSWFHSFAASLWGCCYWSLADVFTGEDRLEVAVGNSYLCLDSQSVCQFATLAHTCNFASSAEQQGGS